TESARVRASQSFGDARADAERQLVSYEINWIEHLLARKDNARARQVLDLIPEEARKQRAEQIIPLEIRIAARTGQLSARLARIQDPVAFDALKSAAND